MKKCRKSHDVGVRKVQRNKVISGWIWPYVIIPACVAALLAIFFLILGPIILSKIGISYSLEFWLIALGVWAFVTGICTLVWIYAGRHLIPSSYYTVVNQEMGQGKIDGSDINTYSETEKYTQGKGSCDQPGICFSDQQVVYKQSKQSEPSPPYEDLPDGLEKKRVDDENDNEKQIEEEPEKYILPQVIETDTDNYNNAETTVIQINDHVKNSSENNRLLMQETEQCQPPRRVSYAGVISVNIPPSEQIKIEDQDRNTLHTPRPPTPRFPRGMRVASNDSSASAQLADLYLNHKLSRVSPSRTVEAPQLANSVQEKVASNERFEVQQMKMKEESTSSSSSDNSDLPHSSALDDGSIAVKNTEFVLFSDRNVVKCNTIEISGLKKVRLSDDLEKANDEVRQKRMSLDRNQFLGWNPEKGVLAEADPGSKKREESRWKRSIGAWHPSTSTPYDHEVTEEQENVQDDDDDVFQDTVDIAPENKVQVSHTVTITKAVIHSTSV